MEKFNNPAPDNNEPQLEPESDRPKMHTVPNRKDLMAILARRREKLGLEPLPMTEPAPLVYGDSRLEVETVETAEGTETRSVLRSTETDETIAEQG